MKRLMLTMALIGSYFHINGQITDTGDNVGIGTTLPNAKLHVIGQDTRFLSNTGQNTLEMGRNSNEKISINVQDNHTFFDLIQDSDSNGPHILYFRNRAEGTSDDNDIRFQTSSSNRLAIKSNGNVGIGTVTPVSRLDVNGDLRAQNLVTVQTGGSYKIALDGNSHAYIVGRDNSFVQKFHISSNGNSFFNGGNVGIGTTDPGSYKLAVVGNIRAKEVKVETGWADYVFQDGYDLPTLREVEEHIQSKGHLINIPSATEVETNGVELGKMNKLLLEKIEELTLYILELNKEVQELKEGKTP